MKRMSKNELIDCCKMTLLLATTKPFQTIYSMQHLKFSSFFDFKKFFLLKSNLSSQGKMIKPVQLSKKKKGIRTTKAVCKTNCKLIRLEKKLLFYFRKLKIYLINFSKKFSFKLGKAELISSISAISPLQCKTKSHPASRIALVLMAKL